MRPIDIQFSRRPAVAGAAAALLLAGAFSAAATGAWYAGLSAEAENAEAQVGEMKRMMRRQPGRIAESPRDARETQQEVRLANAVIQQMTVPWDRLFSEIEACATEDVALLSVQPDLGNRQVRINGEAKTLKAMLDYSRRLEGTGMLGGVVLLGHEVKTQQPQRPVAFAISAGWSEKP